MTGWLKLFTDGTQEYGSDVAIQEQKASWSRGRLSGIKEVRLLNLERTCSLIVPNTNWHQFDRLAVLVSEGTHKPYRTHQVVQAEIQPCHLGLYLVCSRTGINFSWAILSDNRQNSNFCKEITPQHCNKWLTVILPSRDYPYINFLSRGKMNDNKQVLK